VAVDPGFESLSLESRNHLVNEILVRASIADEDHGIGPYPGAKIRKLFVRSNVSSTYLTLCYPYR